MAYYRSYYYLHDYSEKRYQNELIFYFQLMMVKSNTMFTFMNIIIFIYDFKWFHSISLLHFQATFRLLFKRTRFLNYKYNLHLLFKSFIFI